MKAVLALVIIYVGTFFLVIQGASQNPVPAVPQSASSGQDNAASPQATRSIDPAKEADIRSLMELVGARDLLLDGNATARDLLRPRLPDSRQPRVQSKARVDGKRTSFQTRYALNSYTVLLV